MKETPFVNLSELQDKRLHYAQVNGLGAMLVKYNDKVLILYGSCSRLGALMLGGYIEGDSLICGLPGWDNSIDTTVSECDNEIRGLQKDIQINKIDEIQLKKGSNGMERSICCTKAVTV